MLARSALRIRPVAAAVKRAGTVSTQARAWSSLKDEPQYSANATSKGSRADGHAKLDDGSLDLKMRLPKALGGSGGGHNPEELFGLAYSTCFLSALGAVYKEKFGSATGATFPKGAEVKAEVVIGAPKKLPGFQLAVKLQVPFASLEGSKLSRQDAEKLVQEAYKLCPYSRATKGNIETIVRLI